jgi:hypothetical protein
MVLCLKDYVVWCVMDGLLILKARQELYHSLERRATLQPKFYKIIELRTNPLQKNQSHQSTKTGQTVAQKQQDKQDPKEQNKTKGPQVRPPFHQLNKATQDRKRSSTPNTSRANKPPSGATINQNRASHQNRAAH